MKFWVTLFANLGSDVLKIGRKVVSELPLLLFFSFLELFFLGSKLKAFSGGLGEVPFLVFLDLGFDPFLELK